MSLHLVDVIIEAAKNKKASSIVTLDVAGKSDICDFQVICSGDTDRQTKAITDEIERLVLAQQNTKPYAVEGRASGQWILIDFGSVIVHVFTKETREYYSIDTLWPNSEITR